MHSWGGTANDGERAFDPATHSGERVRASLVTGAERDRGGKRKLVVTQLTACDRCATVGCGSCRQRGYHLDETFVRFKFLPSEAGHIVRVRGQGDAFGHLKTQGDLVVHLCLEPREVERLEARDEEMSARQKAWLERREVQRRTRILRRSRTVKWLSVIVVLALGAGAFQYLRKGKAGDECHAASDCRSAICMATRGMSEDFELTQKSQCSKTCEVDDDCPGTMDCSASVCTPTFKPNREP